MNSSSPSCPRRPRRGFRLRKVDFAREHFKSTEVLSSDFLPWLAADDENDKGATNAAFEILHFIARKRLGAGKLTVVDATNVQMEARKPLIALAREFHCIPVAIVFDVPDEVCHERNGSRPDRDFGPHVVRQQNTQLRRSLRGLKREGFRQVYTLSSLEEVRAASIERQPLWNNLRHEHGPFDIIGDLHGCYDELLQLLEKLGYKCVGPETEAPECSHPAGPEGHFSRRPRGSRAKVTRGHAPRHVDGGGPEALSAFREITTRS